MIIPHLVLMADRSRPSKLISLFMIGWTRTFQELHMPRLLGVGAHGDQRIG
jgi:hypothetical protein